MKKNVGVLIGFIFLFGLSLTPVFADGNIVGTFEVTPDPNTPVAAVDFSAFIMDAQNADQLFGEKEIPVTDANGMFDTGPIPAGFYKIAAFGKIDEETCVRTFAGDDTDFSFETAKVFEVVNGETTTMTDDLGGGYLCPGGVLVEEPTDTDAYLNIKVSDARNGTGIEGIRVIMLNPVTAMKIGESTTDVNGIVNLGSFRGTFLSYYSSKIRLVDPNGVYQPEFYGSGEADTFSSGEVVGFTSDPTAYIEESLVAQSTSGMITQTVVEISNLGLDPNVENNLTGSLNRAIDFIEDENPNNDMAACGALTGFIRQLNGRVSSGKMLGSEAHDLALAANEAMEALKCM